MKGVEKESGLERFVPVSLVETMKKKVNFTESYCKKSKKGKKYQTLFLPIVGYAPFCCS